MINRWLDSWGITWNGMIILVIMISCCFFTPRTWAASSGNPRQTGEVVLDELLIGSDQFIIRTASNGCTAKDSFRVDFRKEEGCSSQTPCYKLTVIRIKPDECKEIAEDGVLVRFDLEKDLGLKGSFTYTVTNQVNAPSRPEPSDQSLMSIIEQYFTVNFPELREVRPEPFEKFVMEHDYFRCDIPFHWKLSRDPAEDEKAGIYEINLTMPDKAGMDESEKDFLPDPYIYVGYYAEGNQQNKTFESFIKDYEDLVLKREGSAKSHYEKPKEIIFAGKEAKELTYETFLEMPQGPLASIDYWLKAKFIVIKAERGFFVLAYKSPRQFYDKYWPIFEEVTKSFKIKN